MNESTNEDLGRRVVEVSGAPKDRLVPGAMTVVIRDDVPMIHCGDSPSYRTVRINLTDEQRQAMALHWTGSQGGTDIWEVISKAIVETEPVTSMNDRRKERAEIERRGLGRSAIERPGSGGLKS